MERIMMTVKEVSEALGIGINQTYTLIKKDGFPTIKIGQQYLIPKDSFEQWVTYNAKNKCEI